MSMSRYMHPRNIYKKPPNFKQLAIDYPEFRQCVKLDLTGKVHLDFKDLTSLKALSCTLLKKDFNLDVEMPLNKLIPTIPLRLNYILWIEDLMEISGKKEGVRGIDIGTGASCVYPLISAKQFGWSMLATEIDDESLACAQGNVERNGLNDLINVVKMSGKSLLVEAVQEDNYDFCMCNPPFFSSQKETVFEFKSRKESRPRPKNAFSGSLGEIVSTGGEVEFVSNLIRESKSLENNIRVFSTMLGQKASLAPLKKLLRELDVISFKQTDFCQGNTTRWGLAWTYCDIDLRKVPATTLAASKKEKPKNPVQYTLPPSWAEIDIKEIGDKIVAIFNCLQINYKILKQSKNVVGYTLTADSNTWSHQRRKRRELQRDVNKSDSSESSTTSKNSIDSATENKYRVTGNNNDSSTNQEKLVSEPAVMMDSATADEHHEEELRSFSPNIEAAANLISEMKVRSPGSSKRELEDDEGYYNNKKIKLDDGAVDLPKMFMESNAVLRKDANGVHFGLVWVDGYGGRDVLHQILQYVKNNLST